MVWWFFLSHLTPNREGDEFSITLPGLTMVLGAEAKLTTQNQITIPATIRMALKLQGGKSRVKFPILPEDGRVVILRAESMAKQSEDPALKPFLNLLLEEVEQLRAASPAGYREKKKTKLLAAILKMAFEVIPQDPAHPIFLRGNTLGTAYRHWHRGKFSRGGADYFSGSAARRRSSSRLG